MGRFSPTVRPEPFDFGSILDRAAEGYLFGDLIRDRRHQRQRESEQEKLERRTRRTAHLDQPGTATLADYLQTEHDAGREPLTEQTLQQVGSADQPEVPIEFRAPEPTPVRLPSGEKRQFQDRTPYITDTGVVVDPRRARQEVTLGDYLSRASLREPEEPIKSPWEREGFDEPEPYYDHLTSESKARYAGRPQSGGNRRMSAAEHIAAYSRAKELVRETYGVPTMVGGEERWSVPDWLDPNLEEVMIQGLLRGEGLMQPPAPPLRTADPIFARPPGTDSSTGSSGSWIDRMRRKVFPAPANPDAALNRGAAAAGGGAGWKGRAASLGSGPNLTTSQRRQYNDLLERGWSKQDAIESIAADEWDGLVQGGTDPDTATARISRKFGIAAQNER